MNAHHHVAYIVCRFKKVACFNVDALTCGIVRVHDMARRRNGIGTRQCGLHAEQIQATFTQAARVQVHLHRTARAANGLNFASALDLLQVHFKTARHALQLQC